VEIGVWNGKRAQELSTAAFERNNSVQYHGFDLFELLTDVDLRDELSKRPPTKAQVEQDLREFQAKAATTFLPWKRRAFEFQLYQGYTRESLANFVEENPKFEADVVFIDGGHSVETIENDWHYCSRMLSRDGTLFLDDFYDNRELIDRFGCTQLVKRLQETAEWEVTVLPVKDVINPIGGIQIVQVKRKQ